MRSQPRPQCGLKIGESAHPESLGFGDEYVVGGERRLHARIDARQSIANGQPEARCGFNAVRAEPSSSASADNSSASLLVPIVNPCSRISSSTPG